MSKSDVVSHFPLAQYFPDYLAVCLSPIYHSPATTGSATYYICMKGTADEVHVVDALLADDSLPFAPLIAIL